MDIRADIIKAQNDLIFQQRSMILGTDECAVTSSFKKCLLSAKDKNEFEKSWSSDLQANFPDGVWRKINGASVFINNGKVIAGLGGFNGAIDKFFEDKKKEGKDSNKTSFKGYDVLNNPPKEGDKINMTINHSEGHKSVTNGIVYEVSPSGKTFKLKDEYGNKDDRWRNIEDYKSAKITREGEKKEGKDSISMNSYDYKHPDEAQKRINSIIEGEQILSSGKIHGRKMSKDELESVKNSIDNTKKKLTDIGLKESQSSDKPETKKEEGKDKPVNERSNQEIGESKQKDSKTQLEKTDKKEDIINKLIEYGNWEGSKDSKDWLNKKTKGELITTLKLMNESIANGGTGNYSTFRNDESYRSTFEVNDIGKKYFQEKTGLTDDDVFKIASKDQSFKDNVLNLNKEFNDYVNTELNGVIGKEDIKQAIVKQKEILDKGIVLMKEKGYIKSDSSNKINQAISDLSKVTTKKELVVLLNKQSNDDGIDTFDKDYNKAIKEAGERIISKEKQDRADNPFRELLTGIDSKDKEQKGEIQESVQKYGWSSVKEGKDTILSNRNGKQVVKVTEKGNKYIFSDMNGNKLMSGNANIGKSIEKLLEQYYYAQKK